MFFPYFIILLYIHMCTVQCLICKYLYSGVSNWTGRWRGDTRCIHPSFLSDLVFTAYHLHSKRSVSGERNKEVRRKSKHQAKWYRRNRLQWTYMLLLFFAKWWICSGVSTIRLSQPVMEHSLEPNCSPWPEVYWNRLGSFGHTGLFLQWWQLICFLCNNYTTSFHFVIHENYLWVLLDLIPINSEGKDPLFHTLL